ncbi:MAG: hypothetical protein H6R01_732 [Burkholderiaceae bacterium]|nr:hypothetical protein [Burkholderiaceae bacterium]
MALQPIDSIHALQIQAGVLGRKTGHVFEYNIAQRINSFQYPFNAEVIDARHVFLGEPAKLLLSYIAAKECIHQITRAEAISTGALATSEDGKKWLSINGVTVSRCKSDLVIELSTNDGRNLTIGVSTKQCNNKTPTNAQLFFTTARGFSTLLRNNGIDVSDVAIDALRQFCGDEGFRPEDRHTSTKRLTDPRRYFWEEIHPDGRSEWEQILKSQQDKITRLLLQKAYMNDPFVPEYVLHKTKKASSWANTEVAIFTVNELVTLSNNYQGFATNPYRVTKGTYKDPAGIKHLAPRFGIVQMQRGGQKQHPEQLQFNLQAGYFYKI